MRAESKRLLEDFLTHLEYHLDEAQRAWDTTIKRIHDNPNQMNVFGIWQRDQLNDMTTIHALVIERDRVVRSLRNFIDNPKNRFRYLKKVPKKEKGKKGRNLLSPGER